MHTMSDGPMSPESQGRPTTGPQFYRAGALDARGKIVRAANWLQVVPAISSVLGIGYFVNHQDDPNVFQQELIFGWGVASMAILLAAVSLIARRPK